MCPTSWQDKVFHAQHPCWCGPSPKSATSPASGSSARWLSFQSCLYRGEISILKKGPVKKTDLQFPVWKSIGCLMYFHASTAHSGQDLLQYRALQAAICFILTWEKFRGVNFFLVPFYPLFTTVSLLAGYSTRTRTNVQKWENILFLSEKSGSTSSKKKLWRPHNRTTGVWASPVTDTGRVFGLRSQYNFTPKCPDWS